MAQRGPGGPRPFPRRGVWAAGLAVPVLLWSLIVSTGPGAASTQANAALPAESAVPVASPAADPAVPVVPDGPARLAPAPIVGSVPAPPPDVSSESGATPEPGGSGVTPPAIPPPVGLAPAPAEGALPEPPRASAQAAVAAIDALAGPGGWAPSIWLGVASLDRATGELALGAHGAEPVYTASLSKLMLVVDILDRRQTEGLMITESDGRLIQRALGPSDDGAMSGLWGRFDGFGSARRLSERLGLTATQPPRDPSQWGEMMTSAADVARIYQHLLDVLPVADREFVLGALASTPPVRGADGFDQQYGLLAVAPGLPAMAKQAWMCCHGQQFTLHSAGVVHGVDAWSTVSGPRYVLVLLSRQPRGGGWSVAMDRLTQAAGAAAAVLDD